ncbi:5'-AMP-activated protein kinase beta subunit, interation domain-containing protein [Halenospora varia]|nr:5'-AMP-activated protein kinase beta subunit, interation domain-containing protein [Halenospora varia]
MGNTPSNEKARASPHSASSSPSPSNHNHESSRAPSSRRVIEQKRSAAAPEASLAQARGTTATHRTRASQSQSQSQPAVAALSNPSSATASPSHYNSEPQMGAQQSREEPKADIRDQPSRPVDVPVPVANSDNTSLRSYSQSIEPSGPPLTQDMSYHLTRPPRLPLPIEEEVHTPGSPIIAATDVDVDAPALDIGPLDNETLQRRASALSNTTIDEEDAEELRVDKTGLTVSTPLEWLEGKGGEKVYVTGTIFQWNKKHRLQPIPGQPGCYRSFIHVRPGTHHVRFIVDGIMQCSKNLPTTVDFGNNLVNYIEVSADDVPKTTPATAEGLGTPIIEEDKKITNEASTSGGKAVEEKPKAKAAPKAKLVLPQGRYSSQVPQYLTDLDKAEDSAAYQYAAAAIEKLPQPPSLPGFLGKPILNVPTPMKDDNSVLTMPNHTVLNHLATSSIKNNVLAVSATTRYRRKYVTTIMYKPTGDD